MPEPEVTGTNAIRARVWSRWKKVNLSITSRELQISLFHFIRQLEAVFGVTPHQFRIRTRVEKAKRLPALGNHPVTDVCMEVGASSLAASASRSHGP